MKKLIVGNWKMNGTALSARALALVVAEGNQALSNAKLVLCPPFIHVQGLSDIKNIILGAQDCAPTADGAFTGDISAKMLQDAGCHYVILGHSERRQYHNETNDVVARKALQARDAALTPIICIGETGEEREAGRETDIVGLQLDQSIPPDAHPGHLVIAYEPVWAIGTGKTPTLSDIAAMHGFIRNRLAARFENAGTIPLLYGGSMKPGNAGDILKIDHVDGGLIGGASLEAEQFLSIARQA